MTVKPDAAPCSVAAHSNVRYSITLFAACDVLCTVLYRDLSKMDTVQLCH